MSFSRFFCSLSFYLHFFTSVLLPLLSLFLSLSVCLCVCISMQFPVYSFGSVHVSFKYVPFIFPSFTSFTSFQPVLACKPLTKGSHIHLHGSATSSIFGCIGHILTLLGLLSFPLAISIVRRF